MPAETGHIRSDNKVVQGGTPYFETILAGGAITPGSLVIQGADDDHVVEAGAAALDVLGVADVIFTERVGTSRGGQSVGTDIPQDDPVRVAKGVFLFRGILANGQNVAKGARFTAAAAGELTAAAAGNPVYGVFEESVDASAGAAPILARFQPGGEVNV